MFPAGFALGKHLVIGTEREIYPAYNQAISTNVCNQGGVDATPLDFGLLDRIFL